MAKQQQHRPAPQPQARNGSGSGPPSCGEKESIFSAGSNELIFGRQNFILMGIGLALVLIGLATMSGEPCRIPTNGNRNAFTVSPASPVAHFDGSRFCNGGCGHFQTETGIELLQQF